MESEIRLKNAYSYIINTCDRQTATLTELCRSLYEDHSTRLLPRDREKVVAFYLLVAEPPVKIAFPFFGFLNLLISESIYFSSFFVA